MASFRIFHVFFRVAGEGFGEGTEGETQEVDREGESGVGERDVGLRREVESEPGTRAGMRVRPGQRCGVGTGMHDTRLLGDTVPQADGIARDL